MNQLIENKIFVFVAFAALLVAFGYVYSIMDEPRMADGALEFSEASIIEIIIIMFAPISGITMWTLAFIHSFKHGRKTWGVIILFAWPTAFLYAVMVNFIWTTNSGTHHY